MSSVPTRERVEQLQLRWNALQTRVANAAAAAGRDRSELTVVAVTKTWPASDIAALGALGVRDVGENRVQEMVGKVAELEADNQGGPIRWHYIGQLQRNKAHAVAQHCAALHTLDRAALVSPLERAAAAAPRRLQVFLQLSLDGDERRGGVAAAGIPALADLVAASDHLELSGLMALPPLGAPPRPAFAKLRELSEQLRRDHPAACKISAGMSADLEEAVMEGATHLRVGTDLMGSRA
jgi:pyridoxal phosphate enzyme (YggS family)